MKKQLFYLIINLIAFANYANGKAKMVIAIQDCRNLEFEYLSELKVLKDGKVFKILKPEHDSQQILKNLDVGTYSLVYKSFFEKEIIQEVNITEYKTYSIQLCINFIDYAKKAYISTINQLEENDSYEVEMASQGCFHSNKDSFTITRNKNEYFIKWGDKSKKLNERDIEAVEHFEIELNYISDFGCTTMDTYTINYRKMSAQKLDGSCDWYGFIYLRKKIFGE